jgi:hypothetical protein
VSRRQVVALFVVGIVVILGAGCGSPTKATAKPTVVRPSHQTVALTKGQIADLHGFATLANPALAKAITETKAALSKMETANSNTYTDVANACLLTSSDVQGFQTSFFSERFPKGTSGLYHDGYQGYRGVLAGLDECGMAGDAKDGNNMKTAVSDTKRGLKLLNLGEAIVRPWFKKA